MSGNETPSRLSTTAGEGARPQVENKSHRNENFPVASFLLAGDIRPAVLAFYEFARAADNIADSPDLPEAEKLEILNEFEKALLSEQHRPRISQASALREVILARNLSFRHPLDLLMAFRLDASKHRYESWDDLLAYCSKSANPVGRFVLDLHGESESTWPASDALCTVLQVINHVQDCKSDFLLLNRVYIPLDILSAYGADVTALGNAHSSPQLRAAILNVLHLTQDKLAFAATLPTEVRNRRLSLETAVIAALAFDLVKLIRKSDPLSEDVRHRRRRFALIGAREIIRMEWARLFSTRKTAQMGA